MATLWLHEINPERHLARYPTSHSGIQAFVNGISLIIQNQIRTSN